MTGVSPALLANLTAWRPDGDGQDGDGPHAAMLDSIVGDARVIAWAEGLHHKHEFLATRNDAVRILVERHGITAIAAETSFTESIVADDYVLGHGAEEPDARVVAGAWSWGGALHENRQLLMWLRRHNDAGPARPVRFYGLDMCGARRGRFPHARRGIDAALEQASTLEASTAAALAARFAPLLNRFATDTYGDLTAAERDALSGMIAELNALFDRHARPDNGLALRRAQHQAVLAAHLDLALRGGGRSNQLQRRDAAQAESLRWALEQEGPDGRILVFEQVEHLDRTEPYSLGWRLDRQLRHQVRYIGAAWGSDPTGRPVEVEVATDINRALDEAIAVLPDEGNGGRYLVDLRPLRDQLPLRDEHPPGSQPPSSGIERYATAFDATVFVRTLTTTEPIG